MRKLGYITTMNISDMFTKNGYCMINRYDRMKVGMHGLDDLIVLSRKISGGDTKIVFIISPGSYDLRNKKDVKEFEHKWLRSNYMCGEISDKNILTVLIGQHGLGHHFLGFNLIYIETYERKMRMTIVDDKFGEEVKYVIQANALTLIKNRKTMLRYEDWQVHSALLVYVLMGLTIIASIKAWANPSIWGYSPETLLNGQSYRAISYMFVHANIAHLISNMISLFIFGRFVMKNEGKLRFAAIYFGGGILSAILDSFARYGTGENIQLMTVGASGAIFALLGAIIVECFTRESQEQTKWYYIAIIAVVCVISNMGSGVNLGTHFWGFLAGLFITFIIRVRRKKDIDAERRMLEKIENNIQKEKKQSIPAVTDNFHTVSYPSSCGIVYRC